MLYIPKNPCLQLVLALVLFCQVTAAFARSPELWISLNWSWAFVQHQPGLGSLSTLLWWPLEAWWVVQCHALGLLVGYLILLVYGVVTEPFTWPFAVGLLVWAPPNLDNTDSVG
jgi:hypothetical protein